ncbi:MAG: hypothetical protein ISP77_00175, partial [Methylophilaceae bacterium]|nr:hypothetical protein [Methylophilaceae bacterium]
VWIFKGEVFEDNAKSVTATQEITKTEDSPKKTVKAATKKTVKTETENSPKKTVKAATKKTVKTETEDSPKKTVKAATKKADSAADTSKADDDSSKEEA